jgi:hypothetical protein
MHNINSEPPSALAAPRRRWPCRRPRPRRRPSGIMLGSPLATRSRRWTTRPTRRPDGMRGANAETVVNGVNDQGQLVGLYLDDAGNTDGMLAQPGS